MRYHWATTCHLPPGVPHCRVVAGTIFFGADDAPQLNQMKSKFVAKYDHDGKKAVELRKQWWEEGEQNKWTFLFYHDVKNPVYKF